MSMYPCELHCHSVHSDGSFQISELQQAARADDLALIALTDHNTVSGWDDLDDGIIPAIRGIEWTTYFGHILVLGCKDFVDWRDARPYNIDCKLSEAREKGGVIGIAHPCQIGSPVCTGGRFEFEIEDWSLVDYVEVLHDDLRAFSNENDNAPVFWTNLLDRGFKLAAVYGRDWHAYSRGGHYGVTYIDIDGEVNEANALEAIKAGRTVVSGGFGFSVKVAANGREYRLGETVPEGEAELLFDVDLSSRGDKLSDERLEFTSIKIFTNGGEVALEIPCDSKSAKLILEKGKWYRAELWGFIDGFNKHMAITSPVYCEY